VVDRNKPRLLLPANLVNLAAVTTDALPIPAGRNKAISADVLRLDKTDPFISGNKLFKLQYYLEYAMETGKTAVLTFGGPWSNHILATAYAARKCGLASTGIIRGEQPRILSATLRDAAGAGMQLVFTNRQSYARKTDPAWLEELLQTYQHPIIIPEGGAGQTGVLGAATIARLFQGDYTHIIGAIGTGTMINGILLSAAPGTTIVGVPVLRGYDDWQPSSANDGMATNFRLAPGYAFGGYAKHTPELLSFMNRFYSDTGIPTDFVYTGKLFFALTDLLARDYFPEGARILAIHSGGLRGNQSLAPGTLLF
jgi:1-aminocyclopropane-1-carboxylate deaminase